MTPVRRLLLIVAGSISVGLGVIGIFVPVLPTTPFLLLGAACYARGSRRFYDWLMGQRFLGAYIRNYREGRGMALSAKIATLALLWASLGYSSVAIASRPSLRIALLVLGAVVTLHLVRLPTYRPDVPPKPDAIGSGSPLEEGDATELGGDRPL